jgi:predicted Zn-dependent peptidase
VVTHGIQQEELDRAKQQLRAQRIYARDSLFGQVLELGNLVLNGLMLTIWHCSIKVYKQ